MTREVYSCPLSSCSGNGHFRCLSYQVCVYVCPRSIDIINQTNNTLAIIIIPNWNSKLLAFQVIPLITQTYYLWVVAGFCQGICPKDRWSD